MSKVKQEAETRCELALMGKVVKVNSNDEVQFMTEYIMNVLDVEYDFSDIDMIKEHIDKYESGNKVEYLVVNTVMDMKCITFLLSNDDPEQGIPYPFEEDYGSGYPSAFCYVFNTDFTDFSEFGDCFFEKQSDGFYHRVS